MVEVTLLDLLFGAVVLLLLAGLIHISNRLR